MSCFFAKIFVHVLVIVAVCYFNVKLIDWDPANIYLFKVNSRNTKKWSDICPKLPINTVESRSGRRYILLGNFTLSKINYFSERPNKVKEWF